MHSRWPDVDELAARLADDLTARGLITDPRWAPALREVPRHLFVPPVAWAAPDVYNVQGGPIDVTNRPEEWWTLAYSDPAIITQADDGAGDPSAGTGSFSSSV
ncbi:hypothetical protein [Nonomuraea sp. NPDC049695]|uniref:hypothetical protein n=1 Tax=Nonomuraea sp. NPDC049695 TaxID=3154734 RepID=UPI00343F5DD7